MTPESTASPEPTSRSTELSAPVVVSTVPDALAPEVRAWVVRSLGPIPNAAEMPEGTLLLHTAGTWDSVVAIVAATPSTLAPALVLKNAVPLWQYAWHLDDGPITAERWWMLRRAMMLHNPGIDLALRTIDRLVAA